MARPKNPNTPKNPHTAEYCALKNAIHRCHNEDHIAYYNYGARGIRVCDEWRTKNGFFDFLAHIGKRPGPEYSLDRIDNDRNYEPGNVRWADRKTQQQNRRRKPDRVTKDYGWGLAHAKSNPSGIGGSLSPIIEYQGRRQTLADWCDDLGIKRATVRQRLDRGLTVEQAFDKARRKKQPKNRDDLYLADGATKPTIH